nr:MAG TPA: hypothetical protein [Caudoviricetes sp.]
MGETIKGYKGFNKDMTCRGKQYKENTTYEEDGTEICEAGMMHFCENPYDVLDYYPLVNEDGDISDFAEVEAVGEVKKDGNKSETNKLHIGAKLGLKGFVKACVDFTIEKTRIENAEECTDYDNGKNYAQIGSSGYYAKIGSSGYYAQITSIGKNSVVMAAGYNSIARAKIGSWITLAEWVETGEKNENGFYIWIPKCVKTEYVDGERIKENTFYKLVDGEFKECE